MYMYMHLHNVHTCTCILYTQIILLTCIIYNVHVNAQSPTQADYVGHPVLLRS